VETLRFPRQILETSRLIVGTFGRVLVAFTDELGNWYKIIDPFVYTVTIL